MNTKKKKVFISIFRTFFQHFTRDRKFDIKNLPCDEGFFFFVLFEYLILGD